MVLESRDMDVARVLAGGMAIKNVDGAYADRTTHAHWLTTTTHSIGSVQM